MKQFYLFYSQKDKILPQLGAELGNKTYKDNKGIIWVKNGSDKRKVFSNTELRVMMQRCGTLSADHDSIEKTSTNDIDVPTLKLFLFDKYKAKLKDGGITGTSLQTIDIKDMVSAIDKNITVEQLLKNIQILDEKGQLTLTGLLLLSKNIQRYRPVFTIKCISFVGNSLGGMQFRDKLPDHLVEGNLLTQYNAVISFITRNLRTIQVEKEFNTLGELEIPLEVFVETITNALIHRDYYIGAPIRLFIFDDRIELHSPGVLPGTVTEENIANGISVPRNQLLFNNARFLLPYTGAGSGMTRVMESYNKIVFKNNFETQEFVITLTRENTAETNATNINADDTKQKLNSKGLNKRQADAMIHFKTKGEITSSEYAKKYDISERMARNDLKDLAEKGLLKKQNDNKLSKYIFDHFR